MPNTGFRLHLIEPLGFEALSRQAKQVTFLELDKTVANQLKKNLQTLKTTNEQAQVINQNSLEFLKQAQNQPHFDVVFLDPPFHFGLAEQAITLLEEKNWLLPHALIYVETEKDKPLSVPENWQLLKRKNYRYGELPPVSKRLGNHYVRYCVIRT